MLVGYHYTRKSCKTSPERTKDAIQSRSWPIIGLIHRVHTSMGPREPLQRASVGVWKRGLGDSKQLGLNHIDSDLLNLNCHDYKLYCCVYEYILSPSLIVIVDDFVGTSMPPRVCRPTTTNHITQSMDRHRQGTSAHALLVHYLVIWRAGGNGSDEFPGSLVT